MLNAGCRWEYLNNGLENETVTSVNIGGYMQLDFGVNGVKGNKIQVAHAIGAWVLPTRHTGGLTVVAIDPAGNQIFSYMFGEITAGEPNAYTLSMSGQIIGSSWIPKL